MNIPAADNLLYNKTQRLGIHDLAFIAVNVCCDIFLQSIMGVQVSERFELIYQWMNAAELNVCRDANLVWLSQSCEVQRLFK